MITLETITPVHIGSGNDYIGAEFIMAEGHLLRIDLERLFKILPRKKMEEFISVVDTRFSLTDFVKGVDVGEAVRYRVSVERKMREPQKIREHIKTGNTAFIPGSSIKGAIRTALLWYHSRDDPEFLNAIRDDLDGKTNRKSIGKDYVDNFFNTRNEKPDPKFDLLKFLEVSDFMPVKYQLKLESVKTYSLKQRYFEEKRFENHVEAVEGIFTGSVKLSNQIRAAIGDGKYPLLNEKLPILGLEDGIDEESMLNHLKKVLRSYNKWCLEKELTLCKKGNKNEFISAIEAILRENNRSCLIRTGFGVGTAYQTLIKLIEEKDVELAEKIVNRFKLGRFRRNVDYKTRNELYPPYPKTIEFTIGLKPLGWLKWSSSS